MNFLDNIKVSFKIGLLVLIALVIVAVVGGVGYVYLQKSNTNLTVLYEDRLVPVKLINGIRTDIAKANAALLELMITEDDSKNEELKKVIDDIAANTNTAYGQLEKMKMDAKSQELFANIKAATANFRTVRSKVIDLAIQNKNAEAYALYEKDAYPASLAFAKSLDDFADYYSTLSEQMKADSENNASEANQISGGILFIAFLLLGFSGFYISKVITKPLGFMVSVCKEFENGDFRDKTRTLVRSDEIGQLADALASMRDNLRRLMKNVNVSAEQLAASSEELTASAEQSAQAATQVAVSITDVANVAVQQMKATDDASGGVEQISAGIEEISAGANEVTHQVLQTEEQAKKGTIAVGKAVTQMKSIENTVILSAQVVSKLGERSKEIGQIVDTISGIAGQTNLLALNAAIEAARAGEQGRGFAVVAEEVRKLAEQSQEATKQIAELIGQIQGETENAVQAMNNGTREVKIGAEVVTESGQAFEDIAKRVNQVVGKVQEISTAIEQMANRSQQIVGSVRKIDGFSKHVVGETESVSAATEQQSASMEEISSASQALAQLAIGLQTEVKKFRI